MGVEQTGAAAAGAAGVGTGGWRSERRQGLRAGFRVCLLALVGRSAAATEPAPTAAPAAPPSQTQQMIDALRPAAAERPTRNLVVRARAGESAASAAAGVPAAPPAMLPAASPIAPIAPAAPPALTPDAVPSLSLAIQFESNSARVRAESGPTLANLVAAMQSADLKPLRFVIEGHTDASGAVAANQKLSQERADEVRLYLVALGVHPARLRAVGKGASEPALPADPLAAANRRVRVVTLQ